MSGHDLGRALKVSIAKLALAPASLTKFLSTGITVSRRFKISIAILLAVFAALDNRPMHAQDSPKPQSVFQPGFEVIGIETRTNNAKEATANGEIPKLWQRLLAEGILSKVPGKIHQGVVVVYTNYASDLNGDYTYILGAKVTPGTKAPEGMVTVNVPSGYYVMFVSARGPAPKVVPEAWKQIWNYFQQPGNPPRAYQSDFEAYEDMSDPNNVETQIEIGVKP
jgi:predicted transcriptional regulator YdeE